MNQRKATTKLIRDLADAAIELTRAQAREDERPNADYYSEDELLLHIVQVVSALVGKPEEVWSITANGVLRLEMGIHHKYFSKNFMIQEDPKDEEGNYV